MQETIALDLETSNDGPDGCPEAHWPNNEVLLAGWSVDKGPIETSTDVNELIEVLISLERRATVLTPAILIGQNVKFDIKHLLKAGWNPDPAYWTICDTMVSTYRHSGHAEKFPNLEKVADYWNVPFKKSLDLAQLLRGGLTMRDIPMSSLEPYLIDDVSVLNDIYNAMCRCNKLGFTKSNYILGLTQMEMNGLPVDVPKLKQAMNDEYDTLCGSRDRATTYIKQVLEWSDGTPIEDTDFSRKSQPLATFAPRTISYLMTGEPLAGIAKRGKKVAQFKPGKGPALDHAQVTNIWGTKQPSHLGYPMPEKKIEQMQRELLPSKHAYLEEVLTFRKANKLYNTYYAPWLNTATITGGTIHPSYNTAQTATGRLSSSNPNGQNIPPEAKKVIGGDGIFELDFKQLEIVACAAISKCPDLIDVLNSGKDLHYESGKSVMGWTDPSDMTEETRRLVKGVNFGLMYGGGPKTISEETGAPIKIVRDLIDSFYRRFPGVGKWQQEFYSEVTDNMTIATYKQGEVVHGSIVMLDISERRFYFEEKESPTWLKRKFGRSFSFKPTETKNYPVQGFAGGDLVMSAVEWFAEEAKTKDIQLRGTVHDSIIITSNLPLTVIESLATRCAYNVKSHYNLPTEIELEVDHGQYWKE